MPAPCHPVRRHRAAHHSAARIGRSAACIWAAVVNRSVRSGAHAVRKNSASSSLRSPRAAFGSRIFLSTIGFAPEYGCVPLQSSSKSITPTAKRSVETSHRVRLESGAWYGGVPDCVLMGSPTREAMLKSSSLAPFRVRMTLSGLMSRCTSPLSCSSSQSANSASDSSPSRRLRSSSDRTESGWMRPGRRGCQAPHRPPRGPVDVACRSRTR